MLSRRSLIGLLAIGCISAMVYGLLIVEDAPTAGNSYIGFGTLFLFLIAMPLFIFTEGKGKKVKDYMLTNDTSFYGATVTLLDTAEIATFSPYCSSYATGISPVRLRVTVGWKLEVMARLSAF